MTRLLTFVSILYATASFGQWQGMRINQSIPTTQRIYSLTVSQTDPDGVADIIALPAETFDSVVFYRGNGQDEFEHSSGLKKGDTYRVIKTGDLDGDGIEELVLSSYWGNGFKIYWSEHDGGYSEGAHFGLTGHGKNLTIVDIDNDGDRDIIALSGGSGQPITLHLFQNGGHRSLVAAGIFSSALHTDKRITLLDKNKDGRTDIMVASSFPWFLIFYQQGDGTFVPRYWPYNLESSFTSDYYLADLNNDSKEDIIANFFEEGFRFYEGMTDTLFSEQYKTYKPTFKPVQLFPVDLNRDGSIDLVAQHQNEEYLPTDSVFYLLGKGDFTFEDPQLIKFPSAAERITVEDINGDHFHDIVAYTTRHGIVTVLNEGAVTSVEDELPKLSVYPNPFTNRLNVEVQVPATVGIFDSYGQLIARTFGVEGSFQTGELAAGIYIVKISMGTTQITKKVVKH